MSLFAKKSFVGVDLGHHTLKVAQIERSTSGWRVSKYATALTPIDTIRDGVVIDPPVLGIALKNLLKEAHISATTASIAVSGGTVVVRPVRMPKMAASALRKSIRFEASRYVPNSIEDSYIEFEIVSDSDEANMDVLISAAPKELIDSRMRACEAAGLDIENVEIGAFAAFRSVVESDSSQDWSDKTVALLDIGASTSNLSIVSQGAFSMTRAIPNGGQVLTDTLKNYFKLSSEDAERGKAQLNVAELITDAKVIENPPLRVLHSHLDDMVREVRRSINYWQSQQTEGVGPKQIDQIVMSGGGSQMPGLSQYFEHKLGIPTHACGVFDNVRFVGSHSEEDHGFQLALASGLAMAMAPLKVAAIQAPKPAAAEKPAKAAKTPRPPKPPKGRKGPVEEETPVEAVAPPMAIPTHDAEIQVPAAFQESVTTAAANPVESEYTMPHIEIVNAPPVATPMIEAPTVEMPTAVHEIEAPSFEMPTLEAEPIVEAPMPDVPHLESSSRVFENSEIEPTVPKELQQALDAILDLEQSAQEALIAPIEPEAAPVIDMSPAPAAPVAEESAPAPLAKPAKKPMFSAFSLGSKKPKATKPAAPEKPKKTKAPMFSFSFKKKPKAGPGQPGTAEVGFETAKPTAPSIAAAKPKLGGSLFKKRKPDDTSEAPKKEAA